MKDTVLLGTGNSRTLKSGIDGNMTWEQFRAALIAGTLPIDLGALQPAGVTQVGDPLCKGTLLPDSVATALGLTGDPIVADALAKLSSAVNPLQYVWGKYSFSNPSSVSSNLGDISIINVAAGGMTTYITYGDSYEITSAGFEIINPTTVTIIASNWQNYIATFQNKFIKLSNTSGWNSVAKIPLGSNLYQDSNIIKLKGYTITWSWSQTYISEVMAYTQGAYPLNGIQDNFYYMYIGRPQYIGAQVATGSYTGTGTYGFSNKNLLVLSGSPFVVAIQSRETPYYRGFFFVQGDVCYGYCINDSRLDNVSINVFGLRMERSGNTLSWHNTSNASLQLNNSGSVYDYKVLYA